MTKPALLLIDLQQGFDETFFTRGGRNNLDAESNIANALATWREHQYPVIHIQHASSNVKSPLHPDNKGFAFKEAFQPLPNEQHYTKSVNSAFIGTPLENYLRQQGIEQIVVAGLTTDHCVSTTVRMAGNLGFNVTLLEDATATFGREHKNTHYAADDIHRYHCMSLDGEFCQVKMTEEVIKLVSKH